MNYFEDETFSTENEFIDFKGSEFYNCHFKGISFVGKDCQFSKFLECTFENVNFSNALISQSAFRDCKFIQSKLTGLNFTQCCSFAGVDFEETVLDLAIFSGMNLKKFQFKNSKIHNTDFSECILEGALFTGSDLKESLFNGANLMKADFRGAKNYAIDLAYAKIRKAKFSFPEVISLLKSQEIMIEGY